MVSPNAGFDDIDLRPGYEADESDRISTGLGDLLCHWPKLLQPDQIGGDQRQPVPGHYALITVAVDRKVGPKVPNDEANAAPPDEVAPASAPGNMT